METAVYDFVIYNSFSWCIEASNRGGGGSLIYIDTVQKYTLNSP